MAARRVSADQAFPIGAVLGALADPTRWKLLDVLVDIGGASATTLAERLPVSRQAVVKHLQILEAVGLVEGVRSGREMRYSARPEPLDASARWLAEFVRNLGPQAERRQAGSRGIGRRLTIQQAAALPNIGRAAALGAPSRSYSARTLSM